MDLMSGVVRLCPAVCDSSHFAVLLGAYGASLSVLGEGTGRVGTGWCDGGRCVSVQPSNLTCNGLPDQKILLLLRAYEQNSLSLLGFRWVWGLRGGVGGPRVLAAYVGSSVGVLPETLPLRRDWRVTWALKEE